VPFLEADSLRFYLADKGKFVLSPADRARFVTLGGQALKPGIIVGFTEKTFSDRRSPADTVPLYRLSAGQLRPGKYVLSFHYYLDDKVPRSGGELLIREFKRDGPGTLKVARLLGPTGFYGNFIVAEEYLVIRDSCTYELSLRSIGGNRLQIRNLLIRPDTVDVRSVQLGKSLWNNYPE
jgi:hypothetical protein